jgi:hypothetical protein
MMVDTPKVSATQTQSVTAIWIPFLIFLLL